MYMQSDTIRPKVTFSYIIIACFFLLFLYLRKIVIVTFKLNNDLSKFSLQMASFTFPYKYGSPLGVAVRSPLIDIREKVANY